MQTYYDMLDDGSKLAMAEAWEALAERARALAALDASLHDSKNFDHLHGLTQMGMLPGTLTAAALAEPDGGGDSLFEDEADAAGAAGAEELASIARDITRRAVEEDTSLKRRVAVIAEGLAEAAAELAGLQELADEASA